jgi:hypothetical protein
MEGLLPASLAAAAVAVALALAALAGLGRARRRLAALEESVRRLREDTDAVGAGGLEALARLDRAEPILAALADRIGAVESRAEMGSYDRAIAAAKSGASAAELERSHGLSSAEAGLIVAVHGPR